MAGHSHSANIKFRKDRVDGRRAKLFTKLARMITVAAKQGSPEPDSNPRLRLAIEKARVVSMPKDNIERAIRKATGEGAGGMFEEIVYEGYAACGVAVMLDILTDNRNRTAPEIRRLFERSGGNLGASGSVAYMFERKAVFAVDPTATIAEDQLLELVLAAGAEDLVGTSGSFAIHGAPSDFVAIKQALEQAGVPLADASVTPVPKTWVEVTNAEDGRRVLKLLENIEEHDDVQNVAANYMFPDALAEQLAREL